MDTRSKMRNTTTATASATDTNTAAAADAAAVVAAAAAAAAFIINNCTYHNERSEYLPGQVGGAHVDGHPLEGEEGGHGQALVHRRVEAAVKQWSNSGQTAVK